MLDYTIKVLLFQTLFLAVYDLFLKRETFFQWNRAYLIITSLIAYVIPLLKIDKIYGVIPQEYVVLMPEVMLSPSTVIEENFNWSALFFTVLPYLFWIGVFIASLLFIRKLYEVIHLIYTSEKEEQATYNLVKLENNNAFSFFNYIFLGKALLEENKQQIITHELVHVREKHSIDLLLFEAQKIVFWFNPFSYLFQKRIAELHEFIADGKTIKSTEKANYFQNLLSQTFGTQNISFINHFFKFSLIKKRIVMLNKHKSKQTSKFKYLLMLPLLVGMLLYSSCEKQDEIVKQDKSIEELIDELKSIKDELNLTSEEIESLIDIIANSSENGDLDNVQVITKELLYLKRLKRKEEILLVANTGEKIIFETAGHKYEQDILPWRTVIKPPIFPSCENAEDQKQCFKLKLRDYAANNFDVSLAQNLGLTSGNKKLYINFLIDKNGEVLEAKARAPHKVLEEEGIRLVKSLPKMLAGEKENGKKISVRYVLPISFKIE